MTPTRSGPLCGPEVQHQVIDRLGRYARLGGAFSGRGQGGRVKFEAQLRTEGGEGAIRLDNLQAAARAARSRPSTIPRGAPAMSITSCSKSL